MAITKTDEHLEKIKRELKEKAVKERAEEAGFEYIDLSVFPINPDILRVVSQEDASRGLLMPFYKSGKNLKIAVYEPENKNTEEVLKKLESADYKYKLYIASDDSIKEAQKIYESERYKAVQPAPIVVGEEKLYEAELKNLADLKETIKNLPAEEALNALHGGAIKAGASDIHYQPEEKTCIIRFRIDGILHKVFDIPLDLYRNLANQIKYKAKMKLNVATVPQDGRFSFLVDSRKIDVRVSSLPTEFGESFACRILDTGKKFDNFDELGFSSHDIKILEDIKSKTHGMILCTGPTGCGKTTTLYVMLQSLNKPNVKIITLEDPIEYHLEGVTQSQVNEKRGYTFASGIRAILRQDPDILMIGEIRDSETGQAGCQAALTGHILLSTLHTNSAVESIQRLLTIGLPAFMLAPSLSVVISQRLARRVCEKCTVEKNTPEKAKKIFEDTLTILKQLNLNGNLVIPEKLKYGKGCDACNFTGYRGQMVIAEILVVTDAIKELVLQGVSASAISEAARQNGMLVMREDGVLKAMQGLTTLEEVYRTT